MAELFFLGAILAAGALALILTPLIRAVALAIGFVDKPDKRKIHDGEIAYGGGIVLAAATALTFSIILLLKRYNIAPFPSVFGDLRGEILLSVAVGAGGILTLGLLDDKYRLSPWTKLIIEFFIATGVVIGGVRITAFIGDNLLMQITTVCWIVLITNSFNLLDNMDGLCAGTIAIAAAMLGLVAMDSRQWNLMFALGALAGAAAGFLKYNRSPASIFLGDAGALFAGFLMAC
ncbi:MAG: MraY family glycosyltransferase, partial [Planctomycetota bacterium]